MLVLRWDYVVSSDGRYGFSFSLYCNANTLACGTVELESFDIAAQLSPAPQAYISNLPWHTQYLIADEVNQGIWFPATFPPYLSFIPMETSYIKPYVINTSDIFEGTSFKWASYFSLHEGKYMLAVDYVPMDIDNPSIYLWYIITATEITENPSSSVPPELTLVPFGTVNTSYISMIGSVQAVHYTQIGTSNILITMLVEYLVVDNVTTPNIIVSVYELEENITEVPLASIRFLGYLLDVVFDFPGSGSIPVHL
jgi:hypothetical protein